MTRRGCFGFGELKEVFHGERLHIFMSVLHETIIIWIMLTWLFSFMFVFPIPARCCAPARSTSCLPLQVRELFLYTLFVLFCSFSPLLAVCDVT